LPIEQRKVVITRRWEDAVSSSSSMMKSRGGNPQADKRRKNMGGILTTNHLKSKTCGFIPIMILLVLRALDWTHAGDVPLDNKLCPQEFGKNNRMYADRVPADRDSRYLNSVPSQVIPGSWLYAMGKAFG
jgi:hypothetical protein